jgi:hypothetical protein
MVNSWLSSGCTKIHTALQGAGYNVPITTSTPALYGTVRQLEAFYGAAMAELSRRSSRVDSRERTRYEVFMDLFNDGLKDLVSQDLAQVGVAVSGTAKIHIGGTSKDRKEVLEEDKDRVEPAFRRGLMSFPGTVAEIDREND